MEIPESVCKLIAERPALFAKAVALTRDTAKLSMISAHPDEFETHSEGLINLYAGDSHVRLEPGQSAKFIDGVGLIGIYNTKFVKPQPVKENVTVISLDSSFMNEVVIIRGQPNVVGHIFKKHPRASTVLSASTTRAAEFEKLLNELLDNRIYSAHIIAQPNIEWVVEKAQKFLEEKSE